MEEFTRATESTFEEEGASLSTDERDMLAGSVDHYMDSLRVLYVDLIMLENFALMNYAGVAKILKKHDKNTPFSTQERYLRKIVNPQSFALYIGLKQGIATVEECYLRLGKLKCSMGAHEESDVGDINTHIDEKHQRRVDGIALLSSNCKVENEINRASEPVENIEKKRKTEGVSCLPSSKRPRKLSIA